MAVLPSRPPYNRRMKRDPRLQRLSREHTQALMLAQHIERLGPAPAADAVETAYSHAVAFWAAGLLPHFRAEEECLLARLLRHVPASDDRAQRLRRDHGDIESLVAQMRASNDASTRSDALAAFAARLRTHVRWEEETLFPATESLLPSQELDALGADLAARLPEHPLPFDRAPRL
jgi:hypothetical protein